MITVRVVPISCGVGLDPPPRGEPLLPPDAAVVAPGVELLHAVSAIDAKPQSANWESSATAPTGGPTLANPESQAWAR